MSIVVCFERVSKKFILHHERSRSFQELAVSLFRRRNGSREEFWALQDVSFTVEQGETVGLIGPNGAGKSTVLKLISHIIDPTSGRIQVNGRVGALLELGAGFHPDLTGRENIYMNGSILGLSRSQIRRKLDEIVAFAELERFIDVPVKHYSSGMYLRLGFSVAIHVNPEILLIDEVLAVGDQSFQAKCLRRVHDLKSQGITILLVSHILEVVANLCPRVLWLEDGQIQLDGSIQEVLDAYREGVAARSQPSGGRRVAHPADVPGIRWGSGEAEVTSVEFLDSDGRPRYVFVTGERLVVRMHHYARQHISHPQTGVAIYRADTGVHLSGPNNVFSGYDIPYIQGEGYVDYIVPALPFLPGDYLVSATIYDYSGDHAYDHWHKCAQFNVKPGGVTERYGLVYVPAEWDAHVGDRWLPRS